MIRRFSVALAALALTSTIATGCSTFSKNSEAVKAAGTALTVDDFETMSSDFADAGSITQPVNGEYDGSTQRNLLTRWIYTELLAHELATAGTPIDDKARTAAETSLKEQAADQWPALHPITQSFLITELAAQNTLAASPSISAADVEAAYNAGLIQSNTLCLRIIGFADATAANNAYEQIVGGTDFASVADANNADPSIGAGGVFTNSTTNSECSSTDTLNAQIAQNLSQTPIGQPSQPITLTASDGSAQYYIFLQRPWSEVTDAAAPLVRKALVPTTVRSLIAGGKVVVDSRYGMWNPGALEVTPSR